MKIRLVILVQFVFFSIVVKADNNAIDSLLILLKNAKQDSNKVNLLNNLSIQYDIKRDVGYKDALLYGNQALQLAQKISFARGITNALYNIGNVYADQGNSDEALRNYQQSLKLNEGINNKNGIANCYNLMGLLFFDQGNYNGALENFLASLKINTDLGYKIGIAKNFNNLGSVYFHKGDYNKALNNYNNALKIWKELKEKKSIALCYGNIGNCFWRLGNYSEALNNHLASLKINEQLKNKKDIAANYSNIGLIEDEQDNYESALIYHQKSLKINTELKDSAKIAYNCINIGSVNLVQGNYKEALKNQLTALKINSRLGNKNGISQGHTNIGLIYFKIGNYKEALAYQLISLKINIEIEDKGEIANSYINLGNIYTLLNRFNEARESIAKGLQISKEIGNRNRIKESYYTLAILDSMQGNWKAAYDHKNLYYQYRDSLINEVNTKKLIQSQMQYEFDKREQTIKLLQDKKDAVSKEEIQRQKVIRNSFMLGFAIVIIFSFVVNKQRNKVKREMKRSDELLLNILPAEVAHELKETGSAMAKNFDFVTVLFTDFKDFTKISEQLTPQELVAEINFCFSAFDNIVSKYGIEKIKTIGDAYMCAGGLPKPNNTNPEDVVKAGIEIRNFMLKYKLEREAKGAIPFEIRIGINTGPVVAGIVGIKKFAYDIWGSTVNLTARMESSGETGKVNISGTTYSYVKNKFNCSYRGKIFAKGKGDIDMYFVEPNA